MVCYGMFILGEKMKTGRKREEAGNNPLIYEAKGIFEIINEEIITEKKVRLNL